MRAVGIIAEYNPFHLGHEYHIEEARKRAQADCVVVVMSGDFVQRGEPAFCDKYIRTQCALRCGADLIMELPVGYATSSAEAFACGGITLLDALKVDSVAFGMEEDSLTDLKEIADILSCEPAAYSRLLQERLAMGCSMPSARAKALSEYTGHSYDAILSSPNNILAVEYLKCIKKLSSSMIPYGITRKGNGYHDCNPSLLPSASMLRKLYKERGLCAIASYVPASVYEVLSEHAALGIEADDLSLLMNYAILSETNLTQYRDVNEALANKLTHAYQKKNQYTMNELIDFCKSKELTRTRISRAILHIILGITKEEAPLSYLRILGMNATGQGYLNCIKKELTLPLISKLSDVPEGISLSEDIRASHIYNLVLHSRFHMTVPDEYRRPLIRIT